MNNHMPPSSLNHAIDPQEFGLHIRYLLARSLSRNKRDPTYLLNTEYKGEIFKGTSVRLYTTSTEQPERQLFGVVECIGRLNLERPSSHLYTFNFTPGKAFTPILEKEVDNLDFDVLWLNRRATENEDMEYPYNGPVNPTAFVPAPKSQGRRCKIGVLNPKNAGSSYVPSRIDGAQFKSEKEETRCIERELKANPNLVAEAEEEVRGEEILKIEIEYGPSINLQPRDRKNGIRRIGRI